MALGHDSCMTDFEHPTSTPDHIAFVAAASGCARFDENYQFLPRLDVTYLPAAIRREALAIASLEGVGPRKENLARLIGKPELTNVERGTRIAFDIYEALCLLVSNNMQIPEKQTIIEIFEIADRSQGRVRRPDFLWSIEEDASWLHQLFAEATEKQDPWEWSEIIRQIWTSGRFSSTARRMALIMSPWCISKAFGCTSLMFGFAEGVRRSVDTMKDTASVSSEWNNAFAQALADGIALELAEIKNIASTRLSLNALCPSERSSSSVGPAIDFIIGQPAFTQKALASALKLTDRGAKIIVDKFLDADILEIGAGNSHNRLFICRRTL